MNGAARTQLRPTVFGMIVALVLVIAAVTRPAVADPSVTGLVWAGLLGAVLLGAIWPVITVRTIGLRIVAAPSDLVAGQLATLEVELTGRASGLSIGCTGSGTAVVDVVSPGTIRIPLTISGRGAYSRIRIDVGSDAPFGVLFASRSRVVELPRRLLVGPVSARVDARAGELPGDLQDPLPNGHGTTGEAVRSVRPYVVGDPSHLVHWSSTARTGSLVVRELEPPAARGLAVVVDLTPPSSPPANPSPFRRDGAETETDLQGSAGQGSAVEGAASRAAGIAEAVLEGGARVLLSTVEPSGPVAAEVADLLDVRRRLALAIGGTPSAPPEDWPVVHVIADQAVLADHTPHLSPFRGDGTESETDVVAKGAGR